MGRGYLCFSVADDTFTISHYPCKDAMFKIIVLSSNGASILWNSVHRDFFLRAEEAVSWTLAVYSLQTVAVVDIL